MTVLMCPQGAQRNHIAHLGTQKPAARSEFCGSSLKVAKMHEGPRVKSSGSSKNCQAAGVKFFRHQSAQCHIAHLGTSAYRIPVDTSIWPADKQAGLEAVPLGRILRAVSPGPFARVTWPSGPKGAQSRCAPLGLQRSPTYVARPE